MNVVIYNQQDNIINGLNIEISKAIKGEFKVEDIIKTFSNYFFSRMILDVTALDNYNDIKNYQKLSIGLPTDKIILLIPSGTEASSNIFLSRLISLCGKKGATLEEIVDQLQSTIKCPSYVCASMTKKGISKGTSCPSAIGHALLQLAKQDGLTAEEKSKKEVINPCPVCGEELSFTNGCVSCMNCSYTKCD